MPVQRPGSRRGPSGRPRRRSSVRASADVRRARAASCRCARTGPGSRPRVRLRPRSARPARRPVAERRRDRSTGPGTARGPRRGRPCSRRRGGRAAAAARSGCRTRRPASCPGWGTAGHRSPSRSTGGSSRASTATSRRARATRAVTRSREQDPDVRAASGARALHEHRDAHFTGAVTQRADVLAPARAVEVDGDQPARLVGQQWIDPCRLAPLEMTARLSI